MQAGNIVINVLLCSVFEYTYRGCCLCHLLFTKEYLIFQFLKFFLNDSKSFVCGIEICVGVLLWQALKFCLDFVGYLWGEGFHSSGRIVITGKWSLSSFRHADAALESAQSSSSFIVVESSSCLW